MANKELRVKKTRKQPSGVRKPPQNPPQMAVGWGRGASEYRPGKFAKLYLAEHGEASAAGVFRALKDDLRRINKERAEIGDRPIKGGTYNSFAKYWHWFKLLALIEPTDRREPAVYDFLEERHFYRLTSKGEAEVRAWEDPVRTAHPEFG